MWQNLNPISLLFTGENFRRHHSSKFSQNTEDVRMSLPKATTYYGVLGYIIYDHIELAKQKEKVCNERYRTDWKLK